MTVIDETLAKTLILEQFPQWSAEIIRPVHFQGHDNRSFRLGDDKLIRLPSDKCYVPQVEKEHQFLASFNNKLPFIIPSPIALGKPSIDYPYPWSIYQWIDGDCLLAKTLSNNEIQDLAKNLAYFISALHEFDSSPGPKPGAHNFYRGAPFSHYAREALFLAQATLKGSEKREAEAIITSATNTHWQALPVWVHGDISPGNLLVYQRKLIAVIDFGCLAVGDPACDLMIAWTYFDASCRELFINALPLDVDTWNRGKAWALWKCLQPSGPESTRREQILKAIFNDA